MKGRFSLVAPKFQFSFLRAMGFLEVLLRFSASQLPLSDFSASRTAHTLADE